ncbi:MAG: hypothetical protein H6624_15960 [Bdellovibrionaceae bacterium]|nr:hypothetical protein [Bdellovibrionales bacterium]MCB9085843.1 hypothetical protein [Pseudobdellovibrionaceae bacterium]
MIQNPLKVAVVLVFLLSGLGSEAAMPKWLQDMQQYQKKKESTRWTIEDWLAQKQKVRLMDYWLALNTAPVNFEAALGGLSYKYDAESSLAPGVNQEEGLSRGWLHLYYRILGLSAEYDKLDGDDSSISYMFNFRLLGPTLQSTQLTLHYGLSELDSTVISSRRENQFAAATMTLYLLHFLGLEGHYRRYFASTNDANIDAEGTRLTYGVFLEFGFLRLFGNLAHDKWTYTPPANPSYDIEYKGMEVGAQLFF